jgi:Flp pilus assembly protein CpaB
VIGPVSLPAAAPSVEIDRWWSGHPGGREQGHGMADRGGRGAARATSIRKVAERYGHRLRANPLLFLRRIVAGALLLTAAVLAAHSAEGPPRTATVVFARDLPAGHHLRPGDVRLVALPDDVRPAGALHDPGALPGRLLIGAARTGEPVTDVRVAAPGNNPPGTSTVAIRIDDPGLAELLHAGTKVDVITPAANERQQQVLASMVTVLTVRRTPADRGGADSERNPLVLLAVPTENAGSLAAAALDRPVTVTLR